MPLIIIALILGLLLLVAAFTVVPKKVEVTGARGTVTESGAPRKVVAFVGAVFLVIAFIIGLFSSFYTQDTGDATVQINFDGNIVGQETTPGVHFKWPWVSTQTFNVRNQSVQYAGNGNADNAGNVATGPQITVQDADGVSSNVDINLRYSIRPDQVTNIYKQYKTEDVFKTSFIQNDVRSVVRSVPGQFKTLDLLTKRNDVEASITSALEQRWAKTGVTVDSVSLQEIRIPDGVKESYSAAVKSQIEVTKAQNELAAAKVSSQQQVVQAEAKAKANQTLAKSLTTPVLQQNYLDTLKSLAQSGNLVVVPEGFNGLVNVTKK